MKIQISVNTGGNPPSVLVTAVSGGNIGFFSFPGISSESTVQTLKELITDFCKTKKLNFEELSDRVGERPPNEHRYSIRPENNEDLNHIAESLGNHIKGSPFATASPSNPLAWRHDITVTLPPIKGGPPAPHS